MINDLGTLPGDPYSIATDINTSSAVVGASGPGDFYSNQAFLYRDGVMTALGTLPGGRFSDADALNNDGQVVGSSGTADPTVRVRAFLWQDGVMQDLGTLPGGSTSEAWDINDAHQVVGFSNSATAGQHAFLWQDGVMQDLGTLGGDASIASAINDRGIIVGISFVSGFGGYHAFLYDGSGMHDLGTLPEGGSTAASSINNLNQVVGSADIQPGGPPHAFLWIDGIMADLNDLIPAQSGWTLAYAFAINDAGQIVGQGISPDGTRHAFELQPTTAPVVTCSVADSLLWPPNHRLVNVGLSVDVQPPDATLQVQVYANDNANASDAADIGRDTLQLRAARQGHGSGRVYLIVVTATSGGQTAFDVCTVVVPHDQSAASIAQVQAEAATAEAFYREFQTAPAGYALLGEGPAGGNGNGSPNATVSVVELGQAVSTSQGARAVLASTVTAAAPSTAPVSLEVQPDHPALAETVRSSLPLWDARHAQDAVFEGWDTVMDGLALNWE
jgi:probable HAF family extracellular repeat protein